MNADHKDRQLSDETAQDPLSRLEATLVRRDADALPDDAEIAAFVDGTLDDVSREIFETRLADDPALQAEVEDLRQLQATLRGTSRRRFGPTSWPSVWLGTAAAIVVAAAATALWVTTSWTRAIRLNDSGWAMLIHGDGTVEGLGPLPADLEARVRVALRTGELPLPSGLDRVRVEDRPLMSGDSSRAAFRVTKPTGTFVLSDRPTFQWSPLATASSYRVSIFDEELTLVVESPTLETAEWTVPSSVPRDAVLLWQVEATTPTGRVLAPSPPDAQARFLVLSEAEAQALRDRLDSSGGSHVARALILAEAGLIDEARAEVEALKAQNPDLGVIDALKASLGQTP
jgi:hypothetical protein